MNDDSFTETSRKYQHQNESLKKENESLRKLVRDAKVYVEVSKDRQEGMSKAETVSENEWLTAAEALIGNE